MQRLLIANRGEIALRIARTASEMGIETVGILAPEDKELATGYGVDTLVLLKGRGAAAYLDIAAIIEVAKTEGCDALHPGYGFLSESARLAEACAKAGINFVGPAPRTLALFSDKTAARELATKAGVPVVEGIPSPATIEDCKTFLASLPAGSKAMLKAAAGGGGRGMRIVGRDDDLSEAYERCQSEALRSFGSDNLFAERCVDEARHIEVQILADSSGRISHLWERDCTLQRRHQKLIEIAPAPGLDPELRARLLEAAALIAKAADYCGIGTFEFLVEESGDFFFMEANPRLQVEHTVTEEITGVDLVEVQLRIAQGARLDELGLAEAPEPVGHSIQLRILAESLSQSGEPLPSGGSIESFEMPGGPGIRVDTAMRRGLGPDPAFDSLLAKLIVSSPEPEYERTVKRAIRAISEFSIEGPRTNLGLLAVLLRRPEFLENQLTTRFIADNAKALLAEVKERAQTRLHASAIAADGADGADQSDDSQRELPEGALAILAPLIGTVIEVCIETDAEVAIGQPICILESMKMEHVVVAAVAGRVDQLWTAVGDVVAEAELLASVMPSGAKREHEAEGTETSLESVRPDLAEVHARHDLLLDKRRPEAVQRRRDRGQSTARENLENLCDADSFIEYGALAVAAMRKVRPLEELQRKTPGDAIITGFGTINADLFGPEKARCAILVVDATVLAGTQGFYHHHKIDRLLELAERAGTPIVFFPEGGGGRPNDTDSGDLVVAGLNITSFHAYARLSGKVPRVAIVSGFCFAGSAAFAGCSDIIIATKHSNLGMGGPAMIEGGGLGVFEPKEIGPASRLESVGVIDLLVEDEIEAVEVAKRYLAYFQGPTTQWECADQRKLRHLIPENRRRVYDIRSVIHTLFDTGSVLELRRAYGVGMLTALVRVEGQPFGLIANDPMHLGGAIDDTGAEKAARFLQLCDAFGLPVISLCDTPGFMVGPEIEERGQVRKVSRLFVVGASLSVPLFTIILRKGYGLGAQAMAGGSFVAPFFTLAWPTGEIGGMGLEGAVRLGFKKQLESIQDETEREKLFQKVVGQMYEKGKALNAASQLEFDGVIDPAETRANLLRGLTAVGPPGSGTRSFIDTW
jgi:acetyl/propionyl-CoA carboxylase alpha subunit/acetyl-CoA carboxylase carboxyltransferase component